MRALIIMKELLLALIGGGFIVTGYQVWIIIANFRHHRKHKKNLEKEYLFKYKTGILIIEQLEKIGDFEPNMKEYIEPYIKYNKSMCTTYSNALTSLQLLNNENNH